MLALTCMYMYRYMYMFVAGNLCLECKQVYNSTLREHFRQYYNIMDFLILSFYLASYTLRFVTYYRCFNKTVIDLVTAGMLCEINTKRKECELENIMYRFHSNLKCDTIEALSFEVVRNYMELVSKATRLEAEAADGEGGTAERQPGAV